MVLGKGFQQGGTQSAGHGGGLLWDRVESGLKGNSLRAERLLVHRSGTQGNLDQRTRVGPKISLGEAVKPADFTWKCLSCGMLLL